MKAKNNKDFSEKIHKARYGEEIIFKRFTYHRTIGGFIYWGGIGDKCIKGFIPDPPSSPVTIKAPNPYGLQ